jgi:CheY-like chemotaxis protein
MARGGFYSVDSLNGIHVLVVVHDPEGRDLLASILRYCGALVTTVPGADEALATMRLVKANALVVEVRPGVDRLQLIRKVRSLKPEEGGVIPAVAVNAIRGGVTVELARAAGFDGFLDTPLDPWALCRLVSSLVST